MYKLGGSKILFFYRKVEAVTRNLRLALRVRIKYSYKCIWSSSLKDLSRELVFGANQLSHLDELTNDYIKNNTARAIMYEVRRRYE